MRAKITILDEPISALDPFAEYETFSKFSRNRDQTPIA